MSFKYRLDHSLAAGISAVVLEIASLYLRTSTTSAARLPYNMYIAILVLVTIQLGTSIALAAYGVAYLAQQQKNKLEEFAAITYGLCAVILYTLVAISFVTQAPITTIGIIAYIYILIAIGFSIGFIKRSSFGIVVVGMWVCLLVYLIFGTITQDRSPADVTFLPLSEITLLLATISRIVDHHRTSHGYASSLPF